MYQTLIRVVCFLVIAGMTFGASAQTYVDEVPDGPENAEVGKCYSRYYIPNEYDFKEATEIDVPASTRSIEIPPVYEIVYDTTVIRPAEKKLEVISAQYETVVESVMVAPPSNKWVTGKKDPSCLSPNPEDCQVLCLVEVPAKYKTFKRRILKTPSFTRETNIAEELKITARKVVKTPASTKEVPVPPTYKTVMKRYVSKEGGYSDWKETICEHQMTRDLIKNVQQALADKGYDPGPVDGYMGGRTVKAINTFQSDKNLPIGSLNVETVSALGVSY